MEFLDSFGIEEKSLFAKKFITSGLDVVIKPLIYLTIIREIIYCDFIAGLQEKKKQQKNPATQQICFRAFVSLVGNLKGKDIRKYLLSTHF